MRYSSFAKSIVTKVPSLEERNISVCCQLQKHQILRRTPKAYFPSPPPPPFTK